jgi:hypothetical protein
MRVARESAWARAHVLKSRSSWLKERAPTPAAVPFKKVLLEIVKSLSSIPFIAGINKRWALKIL